MSIKDRLIGYMTDVCGNWFVNEVWLIQKQMKVWTATELSRTDGKMLELVSPYVSVGSTILDIGANVGLYTGRFAKMVGNRGRVIAFEPHPISFRNFNRLWGKFKNIESFNIAVSDKNADLDFLIPPIAYGFSTAAVGQTADQLKNRDALINIKVKACRLDDLIDSLQLPRISVVKIDVEGHELMVIKGAQKVLATHKPVIMLEILKEKWVEGNPFESEVVKLLASMGYCVFQIQSKKITGPSEYRPEFENFFSLPRR